MPDDRPTSNNLLDLAPPDIAWFQERSDLILIPIGSCEQHGAHLPLGTDTITALEVSRRAAEKADVLYAPPFWAGYSPQHLRDAESGVGTITLRANTLNAVLYDIARSLIHHGWNKLVFVNGHGSNTKVLDPLLRRIRYETGAFVALYKPYAERYIGILEGLLENPPDETPGWHASELETSQVMAHNPRAGEDGARRRGPRAGAALAARLVHQAGRRARRRVRRLPVLRVPDGPRRVLAHRRDRQPAAGHARRRARRRSSATPTTSSRRSTSSGRSRCRSPGGRSRSASEHRAPRTSPCPDPAPHRARGRRVGRRAVARPRDLRGHGASRSRGAGARGAGRARARWGALARREAERVGDTDGLDAARGPGPRRQGRDRRARGPSRRARHDDLPGRLVDRAGAGAPARGGPAQRAHARDQLARDRARDPGRRDPRRRHARRARPADAHAGRSLDGRVPGPAELRGGVRLGGRA